MRVQLLRAQTKHTEFVYNLYCNEKVKRGHGLHKSIPGPHWRNIIQGLYDGWQHIFVITNGVVNVGHIALQDYSKDDRRAEVIITVTPDLHRKGVGRAALKQIIEFAFDSPKEGGLGLDNMWAGIIEDNEASCALFESEGFKCYGHIPAFYRFGARSYARKFYQLQS